MAAASWTSGSDLIEKILKADDKVPRAVLFIDEGIPEKDVPETAFNSLHRYSYELHPQTNVNNDRRADKAKAWKRCLKAARELDIEVESFKEPPDEMEKNKIYKTSDNGHLSLVDASSMDVDAPSELDERDLQIRKGVYQAAEQVMSEDTRTSFDARLQHFQESIGKINASIRDHNLERGREANAFLVDPEFFIATFKDIKRILESGTPNSDAKMQQVMQQLQLYCKKNNYEGDWVVADAAETSRPAQRPSAAVGGAASIDTPTGMEITKPTTAGSAPASTSDARIPVDGVSYEVTAFQALSRNRGLVLLRAPGDHGRSRYCLLAASEAVGKCGVENCRQAGVPEIVFGTAADLVGYSGLKPPRCEGVAEVVTTERLRYPEKFSKRPMTIYLFSTEKKGLSWFRRDDAAAQLQKALDGLEQSFLSDAGQSSWVLRQDRIRSGIVAGAMQVKAAEPSPGIVGTITPTSSSIRNATTTGAKSDGEATIAPTNTSAGAMINTLTKEFDELRSMFKTFMEQQSTRT